MTAQPDRGERGEDMKFFHSSRGFHGLKIEVKELFYWHLTDLYDLRGGGRGRFRIFSTKSSHNVVPDWKKVPAQPKKTTSKDWMKNFFSKKFMNFKNIDNCEKRRVEFFFLKLKCDTTFAPLPQKRDSFWSGNFSEQIQFYFSKNLTDYIENVNDSSVKWRNLVGPNFEKKIQTDLYGCSTGLTTS